MARAARVRGHSLSVASGAYGKKPNKKIQKAGKDSQGASTRRISNSKHLQGLGLEGALSLMSREIVSAITIIAQK
jgi:hypothetical protein